MWRIRVLYDSIMWWQYYVQERVVWPSRSFFFFFFFFFSTLTTLVRSLPPPQMMIRRLSSSSWMHARDTDVSSAIATHKARVALHAKKTRFEQIPIASLIILYGNDVSRHQLTDFDIERIPPHKRLEKHSYDRDDGDGGDGITYHPNRWSDERKKKKKKKKKKSGHEFIRTLFEKKEYDGQRLGENTEVIGNALHWHTSPSSLHISNMAISSTLYTLFCTFLLPAQERHTQ